MKCAGLLLLIIVLGGTWRVGRATCVLESDFGFILNCAFKKSGLFRIRNLGGIKAHASLGFSLGDELGFKESISNTELNRRRSVQASKFQVAAIQAQQANSQNNAKVLSSMVSSQSRKDLVTVPPFKPIPPAQERPVVPTVIAINSSRLVRPNNVPKPALMGVAVPTFNAMPSSISRISNGAAVAIDKSKGSIGVIMPIPKNKLQAADKMSSQHFAIRTLPTKGIDTSAPIPQQSSNSIQSLLAATNISEAAFEAAILQRQQMLQSTSTTTSTTTTTTTTTTTPRPIPKLPSKFANIGKVMNAPKEYYPVGYDKNFDDNFASRVELPETSFYCGDQKHFPGLYADEDLGCMVFHVCALTDDGLIMKSFLCPESTLFDQSILKCNWWFYVDCKNSKKLYDSNIPVSKSYQLMKALTFFSSYKKDASPTKSDEKD